MDEKKKKALQYHELLLELSRTVANGLVFEVEDIDVEADGMMRELRQMIERIRRVRDSEPPPMPEMVYEPTGKEEPTI
jgi:hypothetical protein